MHILLLSVLLCAASIWVGGLVAVAIVAKVSTATLQPVDRLGFFRQFGREYITVATTALVVAYLTGGILLWGRTWDALLVITLAVSVLLVITLGIGVAQARQMTRLRAEHSEAETISGTPSSAADSPIQARARAAMSLRILITVLSFALVFLGVALGS